MENAPTVAFATLLRRYRRAAGLSQEALAERAGLSARAVSDLERGVRRAPYRETVHLLAGALCLCDEDRAALEAAVQRARAPHSTARSGRSNIPNLPAAVTPLIGRDEALAQVRKQLQRPGVRMLTLTGPPGIGKTRLALGVVSDLANDWRDGVIFVNLAPLVDSRLVATSMLQALGLADAGGRPAAERLQELLHDKQMLIVLDNFEQVLEAAPLVTTLLESCPGVAVLVTSRIALRLRGEHEYTVSPLALPDKRSASNHSSAMETLGETPAVALFVERACAVKPEFALSHENASAVVEMCHRLDGLPLAIELAAARCKVLTPQAILSRLEHRLDLLTVGARDAPARQRTLRAAIAWSHDLLSIKERILYRRLGVFVGGFTLTAAERVCRIEHDLDLDILDGLTSLVDQSLVQQVEGLGDEPRFTMLETLREYALEQLSAAGEREQLQALHAADVLAVAEEAEPQLFSRNRGIWLQRLSEEQDNIRSALNSFLQQDNPEPGLRLVGVLWLWFQRQLLIEGRQWVEKLLVHPEANRYTAARASALFAAGHFAWLQGDVRVMRARFEEAVAIRRQLSDTAGLGRVLPFLGLAIDDDFESALGLAEEGVERCREAGNDWELALSLTNLGRIAATWGDDDAARPALEEATNLFRALGDEWLLALPLTSLGAMAYRAGNYGAAQAAFAEALLCFRAVEDRRNTAQVLTNLGYVALAHGDVNRARDIFIESLAFGREHGDRFNAPACLRGIANIMVSSGDLNRGARLLAAAEEMSAATGTIRWPAERLGGPGVTDGIRASLGQGAAATAWMSRQGDSIEQIISEVLAYHG